MYQAASGMEHLHSQGVRHRDLKSNYLFLNDEMHVKVADFGTSCLETQCREAKGNINGTRDDQGETLHSESLSIVWRLCYGNLRQHCLLSRNDSCESYFCCVRKGICSANPL
ncbi:hypothetical protein Pfo_013183 [Paulownia fortunei]|nr:hypothetical protein Pfo_013183 [Paulownia fortunei]